MVQGPGHGDELAHALSGLTLRMGSDDEDQLTSRGGIDLYPRGWEHLAHIRNLCGHPYAF